MVGGFFVVVLFTSLWWIYLFIYFEGGVCDFQHPRIVP